MRTNRTPKQTVHAWCHYCIQDRQDSEVENCGGQLVYATGQPCPFFPYRMGKRVPVKVIRAFCLECMGGRTDFVLDCSTFNCQLYPYRMGKNEALARRGDESRLRRPLVATLRT